MTRREPYRHIRWGDAFRHLNDRDNRPVDRDDLRTHLKHRWFAPNDLEANVDEAVYDLFNLTSDERDIVEEYLNVL